MLTYRQLFEERIKEVQESAERTKVRKPAAGAAAVGAGAAAVAVAADQNQEGSADAAQADASSVSGGVVEGMRMPIIC